MRFFKLKFRPTHVFVIPIAAIFMFTVQYYSLQYDIKKQEAKIAEKERKIEEELERLSKECRAGKQESCETYSALLEKATSH